MKSNSKIHPPRFLSSNTKFGKKNKLEVKKISNSTLITTETWMEDPERAYVDAGVVTAKKSYRWITTWELDKNNISTKILNEQGKLVGTYWDITSPVNKDGETFKAYDWYLDVFVTPDDKIYLLDEDELKMAVEQGHLNEKEAALAKKTAGDIIHSVDKASIISS